MDIQFCFLNKGEYEYQVFLKNKPKISNVIFKKDYTIRNLNRQTEKEKGWDSVCKKWPTNEIRTRTENNLVLKEVALAGYFQE